MHTRSYAWISSLTRCVAIASAILAVAASSAWAGGVTYTYDNLNRLIRAQYTSGAVIDYTYDTVGNRLSVVQITETGCGDGVVGAGEQCDLTNVAGETCVTRGFDGGTLACDELCMFDTSACTVCGDGSADPGEQCDGTDLNGETCVSRGFDGGVLTCSSSCAFDTSACTVCGDGSADPGEQCDGADLNGETCVSRGFDAGVLACDALCIFDTSGCAIEPCGNGAIDTGEDCDGTNLGGATCQSQGFDDGALACDVSCNFDTSGCVVCGDSVRDGDEECDGTDDTACLGRCLADCTCAVCGDDVADPPVEACDGSDDAACPGQCLPPGVPDECQCPATCGNGVINPGEDCDDGNTVGGDGCSATCTCETVGIPSCVCPASPRTGTDCLAVERATLQYDERKAGKEKMKLAWNRIATATTQAGFGDPVAGTTSVALCVYDDTDSLVKQFLIDQAGQLCAKKACWKAKSTKGYGYVDKARAKSGISKIGYASGDATKGKADARGRNNSAKGLTGLPTGVVAELSANKRPTIQMVTSDGFCVGATMNTVKKDESARYDARKE